MDKQMYDLVKAAIKEGKSLEAVVAEVKAMGKAAEEDLKPKTPIADKWGKTAKNYTIYGDDNGLIDKDYLVGCIMVYFVQNGFHPDDCFKSDSEFRNHITEMLDQWVALSKNAERFYTLELNNANAAEILGAIKDVITQTFTNWFVD